MNGVHDMGGMQDMGPIQHEEDEPVFHSAWEGRVYALNRALRALGRWNLDADRYALEVLPPDAYLRMSYYERWLTRMEQQVAEYGLLSKHPPELRPPLRPDANFLSRGIESSIDPAVQARFRPGEWVRARNINPVGHTRLPRYVRGKTGVVDRDHGVYSFPDSNAHFRGKKRQHVYSVRFAAPELWGEAASPRDSVYLDLWDDYLEHA